MARGVGAKLGLTRHYADVRPAGKATVIEDLKRTGNAVAVVRDGINDSAALTFSDVGDHGRPERHAAPASCRMTESAGQALLTPKAQRDLRQAVSLLESSSFAVRLADYAGKPLNRVLRAVPKLDGSLREVANAAIVRCLEVAINSLEQEAFPPSTWLPKTLTGLTGGIGGLFGALALPVELPLTTTLMLRSIADIARYQGEDLAVREARLACLEVFALGGRRSGTNTDIGYYASRAMFAKLSSDVVAHVVERGASDASAPVVTRLVGEIAGRFGLVLSERAAAAAVPVVGAVSGATLNMLFMHHFERVATGHFTLRRMERAFGREAVRHAYKAISLSG